MGADGLLQNLGEADAEVILVQRCDTSPEGTGRSTLSAATSAWRGYQASLSLLKIE